MLDTNPSISPDAWGGAYKVFQLGSGAFGNSNSAATVIAKNLYYDGTNWRYIANGEGSIIGLTLSGEITFYTVASGTAGAIATLSTPKLKIENGGNVLLSHPALLGYTTGAGGAVTQATNKSTGVTLNKPVGQITMNNAALASGAIVTFIFTNSFITAVDNIVITPNFVGGPYEAWAYAVESGQCRIAVKNNNALSQSDAVVLNFAVIKGATS